MYTHDSVLRRHVVESNKIEGIRAKPGESLFDDHLAAARLAATRLVPPTQLHRILMHRQKKFIPAAGQYRTCGVVINASRKGYRRVYYPLPKWWHVRKLMAQWEEYVDSYCTYHAYGAEEAHILHVWLLCIHPWVDGNGRTSRLVWNMLRLAKGVPWLVPSSKPIQRQRYYNEVRRIELVFKEAHPTVY